MKYLILTVITLILLACNTKKSKMSQKNNYNKTILNNCPDDGFCTFEVIENKILVIKKDDIGAHYPTLVDGKKTILKYEYKRNQITNVADDEYSEIIYVEVDSKFNSISLKDNELINAKVLFGRLCFCRGKTGYYPVKDGELSISKNKNDIVTFNLDFKVNEVPQIITSISETL